MKLRAIICVMMFASMAQAASPTSQPSSQPAGKQTSLSSDLIHFIAPPDEVWSPVKYTPASDTVTFITQDKLSAMQMALLPKDTDMDGGMAQQAAVAIVKELRAKRQKDGTKVILPATVEKDSRFAIKIHEKYKAGDKTADQLHLYKLVGPRVLMMTINSISDDADEVTQIQHTGEQTLLSAKYNRYAKQVR